MCGNKKVIGKTGGKTVPKLQYVAFIVVLLGFIGAYVSLSRIQINELGTSEFFVEEIIPLGYWFGIISITLVTFFMIGFAKKKLVSTYSIFSTILLITCLRMVFPIICATPILYEGDTINYMVVLHSWINHGINFGVEGNYQHDYPMAYLIAYVLLKIGIPFDTFLRSAPFFVYAIDVLLTYCIYREVCYEDTKRSVMAIFLFSISSLNYWTSVHYCPNLIGTAFYLLSLYCGLKFAKRGIWNFKSLAPACFSIFFLMLSHHLSILYLIMTLLGFSFAVRLFKVNSIKGGYLPFFVLGVYSYTLWFLYGHFSYPSFFNFGVYLAGGSTVFELAVEATFFDVINFLVYPSFVLGTFLYGIFNLLKPINCLNIMKIKDRISITLPLVYFFGFIFIGLIFFIGQIVYPLCPLRVLELLLIGMYPISGRSVIDLGSANPSKRRRIIMSCLMIFVMLNSVHRYYRQIQRRELFVYL